MRHRRCRSIVSAPPHGFTLRASPAVKHGVSPLGTVDERAEILCLLPSPRIACSLADTLTHCIAYYRPHVSYIVLRILSTHCIAYYRPHVSYIVLRIPSTHCTPTTVPTYRIWSCRYSPLTASPNSVPAYRIWSCRCSRSLHRLTLSPHTVYGLADTIT